MRTVHYRQWCPPQSPVRIEFVPGLLHEIRAESRRGQDRGYLFGHRVGNDVRVLAAIRAPEADDPRIQRMEPVGVFISRQRGEVFLTDADLEQVDRVMAGIALVVAGPRAGFFPREADGKIQAVRSHEEFAVAEAASEPGAAEAEGVPAPRRLRHPALPPISAWKRALGVAAMLAAPAAGFAYLKPHVPQPPLELFLKETQGQLQIRWDPRAVTGAGQLEINDSGSRKVLLLQPGLYSATYGVQSGDVEVRVTTETQTGAARWTSPRFVVPVVQTAMDETAPAEELQQQIGDLESQAERLRNAIAQNRTKVKLMAADTERLLR